MARYKIDTQVAKGATFYQAYGSGIVTLWFKTEELAVADWSRKARLQEHAEALRFLAGE
jgi:hypothetical protein